jgi:hypothetical protein
VGTPLADPAELGVALGVPPDDPKLVQSLVEASDRFRGAVRHYVSREEQRVVVLDGDGHSRLRLPSLNPDPHELVVDLLAPDDTTVEVPVAVSTSGVIMRRDGLPFPFGIGNVQVTYTAGYPDDAIPGDIQAVVLDQAKLIFQVRRGVTAYQVGGIAVTAAGDVATGVTQAWVDVVNAYRIKVGDRA